MEILDDNAHKNEGLQISQEIRNFLAETAKWGKFLSIVGFIFTGLMIIASLAISSILDNSFSEGMLPFPLFVISLAYLLLAALYFIPVYFTFMFSSKMLNSLKGDNQVTLTSSFRNLKSLFKYLGISTIIMFVCYALLFILNMSNNSSMLGI